ncbi:hypothetical protein ACFL5E_03835, partial [Candidatus Omnitrophota bacterium]
MSSDGGGPKNTNNNKNHSADSYYGADDFLHPVSFIEVQTNHRKRIWLKVISFFVAFIFLFEQLGIADSTGYKRLGGVAEELLPSSGESDQANRFAPSYLQRQQAKHEDIVRQRMGKQELQVQLGRRPKKAEEEMPLKKKKGSGGGGGAVDYTMTEPDDLEDPHLFNDLDYEDEALRQIDTYDITRHPDIITDINDWKADAEKQEEEKSGLDYWVGYGEDEDIVDAGNGPHPSRMIKQVVYFGDEEEEKIEKVLSGFVKDPGYDPNDDEDEQFKPKFRTDYEYEGDAIRKTSKYYTWGGVEILIEETIFEGDKDNNKVVRRLNYDKDTGEVTSRQDFLYEGDAVTGALEEQRTYDTKDIGAGEDPTEEGVGRLTSATYFSGAKDKEIADYTLNYSKDGDVTSTVINYYDGGEFGRRAEEMTGEYDYRDPKKRVVTYRGEVDESAGDADNDGLLDGYEDQLSSISYYDTTDRLAGEEVLDYSETYARGNVIQTTVYYYYHWDDADEDGIVDPEEETEVRASGANYRAPMTKSVTYWGDEISDDNIKSITYYFIEGRLKGEETADYTIRKNTRGDTTSTMFYYYEGDNRAADSDTLDRMSRNVTYRGEVDPNAVDSDADGILDGYETQLSSITYFDYENREKGKELSDYTEKYNTREQIVATTIYLYEADLKRASEAGSDDRMSRSVSYRGEVDPEAPDADSDGLLDGYEDQLASITYYDFDTRIKGEEVMDYTEKYNSKQQVTATTVYLYEADLKRAVDADAYDRQSRTVTYRGQLTDPQTADGDADGIMDGYETLLSSITYNDFEDRVKGEEVQDYTEKYNSSQEVSNTTVYYYEDQKRAVDAGADDRMSRTVTYRGELTDPQAADSDVDGILDGYENKLASITYNNIEDSNGTPRLKGEEVQDYTEKYNSNQAVTSTTVYLYEGTLTRAKDADSYDRMSRSVTYRGGLADPQAADGDADGIIDDYKDNLSSITYFDYASRLKGEEIQDYTERYNSKQSVTNTTVYYYEDGMRASEAGPDDRMSKSVSYRGELADPQGVDDDDNGLIDAYEDKLASITYYDYLTRLKGEEVTDYTEKFNSNQEVTTTTVFLYEADLERAADASSDDRMARSVTYRGGLADPQGADADNNGLIDAYEDKLASITYYDYASRLKGEEVTDYTEKFNSNQDVTATTVYLYESDLDRAVDAAGDDRMSRSITYRGELANPQGADNDNDGLIDLYEDRLASITYYDYATRLKGEEVTDYTEKFNSNLDVTATTVYLYESDLNRAQAASADDRMSRSVTYRGELADPQSPDGDTDGLIDAYKSNLASITYYNFEGRLKGEEVTDYTEKFNSSQDVTSTTVYVYESDLKRASNAGADDRMARSITYRGELADPQGEDVDNNGLIDAYEDKLASVTYYDYATRLKGEEVTDYTEKFNSNQDVTSTTVYLYESSLNRAQTAGSDDRMSRSVTYRGELADPQGADGDANGLIDAYEDKLASVTYYDYATRLKGEEVTDYTEKYNSNQDVTATTVYLYESDLNRASVAGSDDRMSRSITYRGELVDPQGEDVDNNGLIDAYEDKLASVTYYDYATRLKGEEVTDYTEKFNSNQEVTTTTVYLYESDLNRAQAAGSDDRMSRSVTYRGELADPQGADTDNNGLIDAYEDKLASVTYYDYATRLKGEEVTDYTEKYNSNQDVTATTVYLYESSLNRASVAGSDDRMSR